MLRLVVIAIVAAAATRALAAPPAFDLQGHRGARGHAPENTLAGFRRALELGVSTLEADLAMTRDGVLVLSHDRRLNPALARTPDGEWLSATGPAIRNLTFEQLQQYDVGRLQPGHRYSLQWPQQQAVDGERIPSLAQLFALVASSDVRLNLETKITPDGDAAPPPEVFARAVVDAVRSAGLEDRTTVQSFDWRTLRVVNAIAPEIRTSCLTVESDTMNTVRPGTTGASPWHAGLSIAAYGGSLPRLVKAAGCSIWSPYWRNVDAAQVAEAHALGLRVIPWTVNDAAQMQRMVELGVDGLITDYPDRFSPRVRERR